MKVVQIVLSAVSVAISATLLAFSIINLVRREEY